MTRAATAAGDPITAEVIRHALVAAADLMRVTLRRTAFSPIIYEITDFAAALYDDEVCWVVPGSHLRRDLPREIELFPDRPIHGPELNDRTVEEREILCLNYCQSMPGGVQLYLGAGDFALYRNTLRHIGSYVPYRKRATIHDSIMTPEFIDWTSKALAAAEQRRNAGYGMENPYLKS